MRSGTDYVGVLDDQLRWDTTRATISCSLRYKLLYVSGLHLLAHLKLFVLGTSGLQMLYLSFSRIARRLCVCVCGCFGSCRGHAQHALSPLSSCSCVTETTSRKSTSAPAQSPRRREICLYSVYLFPPFFVLMRSFDRIGWESPGLICGISAKKRLSLSLMVFYWDFLF